MRKLLFIGSAALMFLGCNGDKKGEPEKVQDDVSYDYRKLPKKEAVNQEARTILDAWPAFSDLSKSIDIVYQATNNEDLSLAVQDLLEKEKLLAESKYPDEFDMPQIKSRQRVFRTFMLKAKGDLNGNRNPTESMVQLLDAYNALRNQFNIIMNNRLELNLFLNEE